jgi:competence protein ComEA
MKTNLYVLWLLLLCTLSGAGFAAQEIELSSEAQYEGITTTVNINRADAEELATLLQGVGIQKAQSIIEYRTEHGPFHSPDDLAKVSGIGAATVEKNRSRIIL